MDVTREHRSRPLAGFGSERATIAFLGGRLVRFDLEPGGRVGLHPTVGEQVLVVVREGGVVRRAAGEEHETVARTALTALVVE